MEYSNGHFYSASQYYQEIFGSKVYKISLDAGCTCPNRDGTKGFGGCIFCSVAGSGDFAASRNVSINDQVEQAKKIVSSKIKNGRKIRYIAYFQNFTSTYGDENALLEKFNAALECADVSGLAIGTRPDCISEKMLENLAELSEKNYLSIELGFQSSKTESVEYIRRMYENSVFLDCVRRIKLKAPKIHVVAHIIFGLPGENKHDMMESVKYAVDSGIDGIKISVLHVLKGTDLEKDYKNGFFRCLEKNEYFGLLADALEIIPENIVVHRVTGDGSKKILVAPLWTANKRDVLNSMVRFFDGKNILQGKKLRNPDDFCGGQN